MARLEGNHSGPGNMEGWDFSRVKTSQESMFGHEGKVATIETLLAAGLVVRRNSPTIGNRTIIGVPLDPHTGKEYSGWVMVAPPKYNTLVMGRSGNGKTNSFVVPNALASETATVATSTRPDIIRETAPELIARGRPVWVFDPSGLFAKQNRELINEQGIKICTWSPLNGDGSFRWATQQARLLIGASDLQKDTGDNTNYWNSYVRLVLGPLIQVSANADAETLHDHGVRTKIQLLMKLADVTEQNLVVAQQAITDNLDQLQGRMDALRDYADAIRPLETSDAAQDNRNKILKEQFTTIQQRYEAAIPAAEATLTKLTTAEEEGRPDEIAKRYEAFDKAESEKMRLAGAVRELYEMAISENNLTAGDAMKREDDLFKERLLIKRHAAKLKKASRQIDRTDTRTADAYDQMLQMVLEPWENKAALNSAEIENKSDIEIFDPARFLSDGKNGILYVFIPLKDADVLAPIGNSIVSAVFREAIEQRDSENPPKIPRIILDEQATAAPMENFDIFMTAVRDRVELITVVQTPSLLRTVYGNDAAETIMENHQVHIIMPQGSRGSLLPELSGLIGNTFSKEVATSTGNGQTIRTTSQRVDQIAGPDALHGMAPHTGIVIIDNVISVVAFKEAHDLGVDKRESVLTDAPNLLQEVANGRKHNFWGQQEIMNDNLLRVGETITALNNARDGILSDTALPPEIDEFLTRFNIPHQQAPEVIIRLISDLRYHGTDIALRLGINPAIIPELDAQDSSETSRSAKRKRLFGKKKLSKKDSAIPEQSARVTDATTLAQQHPTTGTELNHSTREIPAALDDEALQPSEHTQEQVQAGPKTLIIIPLSASPDQLSAAISLNERLHGTQDVFTAKQIGDANSQPAVQHQHDNEPLDTKTKPSEPERITIIKQPGGSFIIENPVDVKFSQKQPSQVEFDSESETARITAYQFPWGCAVSDEDFHRLSPPDQGEKKPIMIRLERQEDGSFALPKPKDDEELTEAGPRKEQANQKALLPGASADAEQIPAATQPQHLRAVPTDLAKKALTLANPDINTAHEPANSPKIEK
ncbi:MAG TPA: type IV secretory system conjugative DNA transfer family protein [Candidatus Sulfotelmatobacter sp.]|jgi:hypothetical protein|nr:type IV secretory system conjugative DNA transfer family protein [Candidatus Sulfotelmatobacter sp.]